MREVTEIEETEVTEVTVFTQRNGATETNREERFGGSAGEAGRLAAAMDRADERRRRYPGVVRPRDESLPRVASRRPPNRTATPSLSCCVPSSVRPPFLRSSVLNRYLRNLGPLRSLEGHG